MDPPSLRYWQQKMFFFKVYEEVLGLLDFLHFFGITFTLEDETPLIDFQIKKTNPLDFFFQTQKKQVVSKWAGSEKQNKNIHYPMEKKKKTMHAHHFFGGHPLFWVLFRSPPQGPNHQKKPIESPFRPTRHPPILGGGPASLGQRIDLRSPPRGFLGKHPKSLVSGRGPMRSMVL